jgi:predicted amidophosphoribosyltransferase
MTATRPRKIVGEWDSGYALDLHTSSSELLGHDSYGHPQFATTRTELGELVYRAKYQKDRKALDAIAKIAGNFISSRDWDIDIILPVPPSDTKRQHQPVFILADRISSILGIPVCLDCIVKVKETPQLKNVYDYAERSKLLKGAFEANKDMLRNKKVLLLDDLYRSGATLNAVTRALLSKGSAERVYALAITMTRSRT